MSNFCEAIVCGKVSHKKSAFIVFAPIPILDSERKDVIS